jgi:chorismate synthase
MTAFLRSFTKKLKLNKIPAEVKKMEIVRRMIKFSTAGESHGQKLITFLEGIPSGLSINIDDINLELARRQRGFGRGQRMNIETDRIEIISGVRHRRTLGTPIVMFIKNRDFQNWIPQMSPVLENKANDFLTNPRPGHADLAGLMKYGVKDFRDILERASARETAAKVAGGAVCKMFLKEFGIFINSYTEQIGGISIKNFEVKNNKNFWKKVEESCVRCPDINAEKKMAEHIKNIAKNGDTVGGKIVIIADNIPVGLGSHTQWDLKLDGKLAQSLIAIQAFKSIEFGIGTKFAGLPGSLSQDEIFYNDKKSFFRKTNRAGGIEGGISNGEPIVISCSMKPIPSLSKALKSVDIYTKKSVKAEAVRSDVCAVPAAGVVAEAAVAIELAKAVKEFFGGECMKDIKTNFANYIKRIKAV